LRPSVRDPACESYPPQYCAAHPRALHRPRHCECLPGTVGNYPQKKAKSVPALRQIGSRVRQGVLLHRYFVPQPVRGRCTRL